MTGLPSTAQPSVKPKRLGERLLAAGLIKSEQLDLALREAQRLGVFLGESLVQLGFINEEVLTTSLAQDTDTPVMDVSNCFIHPEVLELVPLELARQYQVIPIRQEGNILTIVLADTYNVMAVDTIERTTGLNVEVMTAPTQKIMEAIECQYAQSESISHLVDELIKQGIGKLGEEAGREAPMIRLCNQIITVALQTRVTDIHIEPDEQYLRVRMRVDGILGQEILMPKVLQPAVTARFKLMAHLNITEKRVPQDGRLPFTSGSRRIDIRLSTLPTHFGESLVLRVLDKSAVKLEFDALGLTEEHQTLLQSIIHRPHGIILVTGPTGSGKTTTLYTALQNVDAHEKSVFTLEDPVEYQVPLVRQTQINTEIGMTFAAGLRALLRQDPDVILVGEIRDQETAELAIRAALTGHLVFSTLHTNDAVGAIPRLIDMGVEPYLLASALVAVIGQRLVRRICPGCKREQANVQKALAPLKIDPPKHQNVKLWEGTGCSACGHTGFRGRQGIFEVLLIDEQLHAPIIHGPDVSAIRAMIRKSGAATMQDDGLARAFQGVTTIDEVLRVTNA